MRLLSVLFLSAAILSVCHGSKILGIFPMPSKSHYILGESLLRGLAQRGHEVTMISPFKLDKPIKNYRDVEINGILNLRDTVAPKFISLNTTAWERLYLMLETFPKIYHTIHNASNVREFVKREEKFDACIVSFMVIESLYSICNIVQAPPIAFSLIGMNSFLSYATNNPVPYSYVATPFITVTETMTFIERVKNLVTSYFLEAVAHFLVMPYNQKISKLYYPNSPSLYDLMENVDLYFINSHISTDAPKPLLPNIVPIGGYHMQIMDKIPTDVLKFLDASKRGVIYFSMGSNAKSSDFEPQIKQAIINSFAKLDYDILWKYETDLPDKPKNVYIAKWLPQRSILNHPKVKIFITHGGLGGTVESIYGGVPMLCMPMFGDQGKNCADSAKNGYAVTLDLVGVTEEKLTMAIKELMENPTYKEAILLKSDLYKNQEINPMDKAIFWVEHVIRHKGAKHLKSRAASIPWYQYYLLDVYAFFFVILLIFLVLVYWVFKLSLKLLCWLTRKITSKKCKNNRSGKKEKVKKQ